MCEWIFLCFSDFMAVFVFSCFMAVFVFPCLYNQWVHGYQSLSLFVVSVFLDPPIQGIPLFHRKTEVDSTHKLVSCVYHLVDEGFCWRTQPEGNVLVVARKDAHIILPWCVEGSVECPL